MDDRGSGGPIPLPPGAFGTAPAAVAVATTTTTSSASSSTNAAWIQQHPMYRATHLLLGESMSSLMLLARDLSQQSQVENVDEWMDVDGCGNYIF